MEALRVFLNQTPSKGIQEYFDQRKVVYPPDTPWDDFLVLNLHLQKMMTTLPEARQVELNEECQRINRIASANGQQALEAVVQDWSKFSSLEDQFHRSQWFFVHEPQTFLHAESLLCFHEYRGRSRRWSRFGSKAKTSEPQIQKRKQTFRDSVQNSLRGGDHTRVEVFSHHQHPERIQLNILREQLAISEQSFSDAGELVMSQRKPVFEFIILFDIKTSQFEITAGKAAERRLLAEIFARDVLDVKDIQDITQCEYNLSSLMGERDFQLGDDITDVKVIELGILSPSFGMVESFRLDTNAQQWGNLYRQLNRRYGNYSPLVQQAEIKHAHLRVCFRPTRYHPKGKKFTFKISMKNCDLPVGAEYPEETLIRAHYLKLWGLEEETPSWMLD